MDLLEIIDIERYLMDYRICRLQHGFLTIRQASQLCSFRSTPEPRRMEAAEDCSSDSVLTSTEDDKGKQETRRYERGGG